MRALVGVHDPRRLDPDSTLAALTRALDGEGPVRTGVAGSLVVAWAGGEPAANDPFCVVDGRVYAGLPQRRPGETTNAALAAAYREHGEALFERLRGDFAILIYDEEPERGVLARDQLGGRGLCWHQHGDRLTFASDVRWLLPLLPSRPSPDPVAMAHWIGMSGLPATRTPYEGVHRLDAAHVLRFGGGAASPQRYWLPRYRRPTEGSREEHVAALRGRLVEAVDRRTTADEPFAMLLSGGLDSSTVAAFASRLDDDRRPRRAYSATFPDHPSIDEGDLIDLLCARLDLTGTRIVVRSGSVVDGAAEYINHWQLPPPSPNLFFWLPLMRQAAADGMVGFLDGEGGDELFGLAPYLMADRIRRGRVASAFDLARRIPGGGAHLRFKHLWPFVKQFGVRGAAPPGVHAYVRRRRASAFHLPPYLRPATSQAYASTDVTTDWKRLPGPRWWAYLVSVVTLHSGLPMGFDHMRRRAAQAGLESRHPLVDVDVIEQVLSMPPELAFDTRYSRPLQREVVEGLLPDEVRVRPTKSSFDAMFHDALAGPDLATAREVLRPGVGQVGAYVDLAVVADRLLGEPPPPGERLHWAMELWRLLTAECWLRAQERGTFASQAGGPLARSPSSRSRTGAIYVHPADVYTPGTKIRRTPPAELRRRERRHLVWRLATTRSPRCTISGRSRT